MTPDEQFMQRALDLATLGKSSVSPNPLVGCVIVCNEKIIGEGWHKQYGGPHAEVNAIHSVRSTELLADSTVYVSLEPCAHHGKTPPCADLLISRRVKKVVVATEDPNPLVGGKGIVRMRNAGIEIVVGVLEGKAREMNKRFFTSMEKHRPYIILKWAQTKDGHFARKNLDSKWISGEESRKLVHKWRGEEDAILVGSRTARVDNPLLTCRTWLGRNPVRVVLDRNLVLGGELNIFNEEAETIRYHTTDDKSKGNVRVNEEFFLKEVLQDLCSRNIQSLFVEGGSQILNSFIEKNLWDEARVFISKKSFGEGIEAPIVTRNATSEFIVGEDKLLVYRNDT